MREAGYTATEALAALAILGLSIGGLAAGLKVIANGQLSTSIALGEASKVRQAGVELTELLSLGAPFRSDDLGLLAGDAEHLSFPCDEGRCSAALEGASLVVRRAAQPTRTVRLPSKAEYVFTYVSDGQAVDHWPVEATASRPWRTLSAVAVEDRVSHRPALIAQIWSDQAANCEFDPISRDCRKAAP